MIVTFHPPQRRRSISKRLAIGSYYIPFDHQKFDRYIRTRNGLLSYLERHCGSFFAPVNVYRVSAIKTESGSGLVESIRYDHIGVVGVLDGS